jgi:hypothetical protein
LVSKKARWSAAWLLAQETWARRKTAHETRERYQKAFEDPQRPELLGALDAVADMNALARDNGHRFLVILWPLLHQLDAYPFGQAHRRIAEGLRSRGVPFLDLLPTFEGHEATELHVHPTDHHPNEVAHGMAAQKIQAEIRRRGWVP